MPYNNLFPVGYQPSIPFYPPFQQPQQPQQPQQQTMSPPTVHADIIQVSSEQIAEGWQVAAGTSQMFIAQDDSAIYVKTAFANGGHQLDVFIKRPPAPAVDLNSFVTWDKLEERLKALSGEAEE